MSLEDSSFDLCPLNSESSDASFTSQVDGDSDVVCRTSTPKKSGEYDTAGRENFKPNGESHSKDILSTQNPDVSGTVNQSRADEQMVPSISASNETKSECSGASGNRISEFAAENGKMQECIKQDDFVIIDGSGDAKQPRGSMLHSEQDMAMQDNGTMHRYNNTSDFQNTSNQSDGVDSSAIINETAPSPTLPENEVAPSPMLPSNETVRCHAETVRSPTLPTNLNSNGEHVATAEQQSLCNNISSNSTPEPLSAPPQASPPASKTVKTNGNTNVSDMSVTNDTVITNNEQSNQSIPSPTVVISSEESHFPQSKVSSNNAVFQTQLTPDDRSYSTLSLTDSECLQLSDTDDNVSICSYDGRRGSFEKSSLPDWLEVGVVVIVGNTRRGVVKYIGNTAFKPGVWVGVALDDSVGKIYIFGGSDFICRVSKNCHNNKRGNKR